MAVLLSIDLGDISMPAFLQVKHYGQMYLEIMVYSSHLEAVFENYYTVQLFIDISTYFIAKLFKKQKSGKSCECGKIRFYNCKMDQKWFNKL